MCQCEWEIASEIFHPWWLLSSAVVGWMPLRPIPILILIEIGWCWRYIWYTLVIALILALFWSCVELRGDLHGNLHEDQACSCMETCVETVLFKSMERSDHFGVAAITTWAAWLDNTSGEYSLEVNANNSSAWRWIQPGEWRSRPWCGMCWRPKYWRLNNCCKIWLNWLYYIWYIYAN